LSFDYQIRGEDLIENEKELINEANDKPALIRTIKLIKVWRKFFTDNLITLFYDQEE